MRSLTIKRRKSSVASMVAMKVYIEDYTSNEIVINGVPCRKIGKLKNGKEITFEISEGAAKVFVIGDKLSKNYCNDFFEIPEGEDDIYITGKNEFNPMIGNPFRFDTVSSEEVLHNRKKTSKKGIIIFCACLVIGFIIGILSSMGLFTDSTPQPKEFSTDGMSIILTDEFSKSNIADYSACYDSQFVAVFAIKESFSSVEGFENYTLDEYRDLVLENNSLTEAEIKTLDGLNWFEYEFTNEETNETYKYFSFVFKSNDAFWLVQFAVADEKVEEYSQKIIDWANTVTFIE